MKGSRIPNPVKHLALAPLDGAAAMGLAADPAQSGASIGPAIPLSTPAAAVNSSPAAAAPPQVAVASPGRHSAAPVRRIPRDAKPLIPPAAMPGKLRSVSEPRPALSPQTDLEALSPASSPASSVAKLPSS
jgi:hypothetical protein